VAGRLTCWGTSLPPPPISSEKNQGLEQQVLSEKLFAAEKRLTVVRLVVIAANTLIYTLLMDKAGTIPWLAYGVIGVAWAYALYVYVAQPYRKYAILRSSYFTSVSDSALIVLWLHATGGFHSPFFLLLYISVVAISFRYPIKETVFAALLYAFAYGGLLAVSGEVSGHWSDAVVRITYIFISAMLGATISGEVLQQMASRLKLEEQLRAEEQAKLLAAQEAIKLREDFLSIAGHELKTPLTALQLQVEGVGRLAAARAGEAEMDARILQRLEKASRHLRRVSRMVEDLLDVSRITSGRLKLEEEYFDLAEMAHDVINRYAETAVKQGCQIEFRDLVHPIGHWDRMRLEQVLTNLLSNAIKYGSGKPVGIEVADLDGWAVLKVTDHGIGIQPKDQQRIFERFERAASEHRFGGFGLGLWIAKRIIEASGGKILLDSAEGQGATFSVILPLRPSGSRFPPLGRLDQSNEPRGRVGA